MQKPYLSKKGGDLQPIEVMLYIQAKALELIFTRFARMAAMSKVPPLEDKYLRLALKAQGQCTRTLATLHNIKVPANVPFVKQTNIGNNVQVNNGAKRSKHRTKKNKKSANELLEGSNEKRLDRRKKGEAIEVDTAVAAMDKVNRA